MEKSRCCSEMVDFATVTTEMENGTRGALVEGSESLSCRQVRSVYLITYSQANLELVPTRDEFARIVLDSFANSDPCTRSEVSHWVCSQEQHSSGGVHYHMAVKLASLRRWVKVRNYLQEQHGIKVNFSNKHCNYYSAWNYTVKEDSCYLKSANHPDLEDPHTTGASSTRVRLYEGSDHSSKRKKARRGLSIYDVSQIAVGKGIKTRLELVFLANEQKNEGKCELAQFIANRGSKSVDEALSVGWEFEEAGKNLQRTRLSRIEILYSQLAGECIVGCQGQWLLMAKEILERNNIRHLDFAEAVRTLLQKGRGKYRNLYIKGPCNCGKTFLLNPLNILFKTFCNPASTTFAWVGAQEAEVIFLNDCRWSPHIIPWHDFLMLLEEGQEVHLPAPKTHYKQDLSFKGDTPIFCTSKDELSFVRGGVVDDRETDMMRARWRLFSLQFQIPEHEQRNVSSCGHCFSQLIFPQGE